MTDCRASGARESSPRSCKKAHRRNTEPMLASARCGAKTRSGGSCRAPAVTGKKRCRMHGGGVGSGAPVGNHNALTHGGYTGEVIEMRRKVAELMRGARLTLREMRWGSGRPPPLASRGAGAARQAT